MRLITQGIAVTLVTFASAAAAAEPAPETIASGALENNMFATNNAKATIQMEISRRGKVVRRRQIRTLVKRNDGLIKSFVEFEKPADVAGTKFLSIEVGPSETKQFIYLPAFKKVKRIVGAQRGKSFMGTDFSYSDLEGRDVSDSNWKRRPDEKVKGQDCYVIEGVPKKPDDEQYGMILLWIHKANEIPLKSEFYDKKRQKVVKRLTVNKLSRKDGRWIAVDSVMETLKKKSETRLKVVAIDLKSEIPDTAVTREALER